MEWHLQPLATACCVSGRPFAEGDRVVSFLVRSPELGVERFDAMEDHAASFSPRGVVACRWLHVLKPRAKGRDADRALKLTAENLFLTLADPSTEPTEENGRLVQFLVLMLERKRLLRARGATADGSGRLWEHARTKRIFEVPARELTPEFFVAIQRQLSVLVGNG